MIATQHRIEYSAACSAGQPVGAGPNRLPNRSLVALITAVNGFQSAIALRKAGRVWVGTNAEEMKLSGNIQISPALCATSTLRAASPISAPTHDSAQANISITR